MRETESTIHSRRRELRGRQADDATCGNSSVQVSVDQARCLLSFDWATVPAISLNRLILAQRYR
jgi:hypothetical protein